MDKRLIELALEALELRKASIDAEIAAIREELAGGAKASLAKAAKTVAPAKKRGPRSRAARKAQSDRMKAYWAKKKAESSKAAQKPDNDSKKKKQAAHSPI